MNLPQTAFPMRGNLAEREPQFLADWERMNLYDEILSARKTSPRFVLHDGPPYSNGHIHYGHILNKILKDLVVKYKTMAGFRAPYLPGWDTHGLPIELAVDRELGDKKRSMSKAEIRSACRDYALKFVDLQREEFKRLGVFGAWDKPYLTLNKTYDAAIVRALAAFARGGYLFRGKKPVYWCPTDRTALAEAEIEYADHTSPSIFVRFPMTDDFSPESLSPELAGKKLALSIWTTTPWTLPANLAVVINKNFEYVAMPSSVDGEYLIVAKELAASLHKAMGGEGDEAPAGCISIPKENLGKLEGARYLHPFMEPRADNHFRVWFADYVTLEAGTGLVHTAPGHGADDYRTGVTQGLEPYAPVDDAGVFTDDVPNWAGRKTRDANPEIVDYLAKSGFLLNKPGEKLRHSYPHCWRCKGPVLFRATDQWFIGIDHNDLRQRALSEIENTEWVPTWGHDRIHGMIANRPDWCLSRQRTWGVPIPAFYCKGCGTVNSDANLMEHVASVFEREGADAWYTRSPNELTPEGFTCSDCGKSEFEPEQDIVDVWFESGCSWFAVPQQDAEIANIDLYLEGSDQHRGWFHSSLLVGIGLAGKAPYKTVITHGFVLDETGRPYSKSEIEKARREGKKVKYIAPDEVIAKYGTEMFRLWVASTEFRNDIPYSETIVKQLAEWYRKFRMTARFMLGNLADFDPSKHPLEGEALSELDRFALLRLGDLVSRVRDAYDAYEFHVVYRSLVDYVAGDLSSLYIDVIKDRLYSDAVDAPTRRAAQAVLYSIVRTLALVSAPILAFTAEDIWRHLPSRPDDPISVHLAEMPVGRRVADDDEFSQRWQRLLEYRDIITKELEAFRAQKHRSEDALVRLQAPEADRALLEPRLGELAELCIVSRVVLAVGSGEAKAFIEEAPGTRCERCWRWFEQMSTDHEDLCPRCSGAVRAAAGTQS